MTPPPILAPVLLHLGLLLVAGWVAWGHPAWLAAAAVVTVVGGSLLPARVRVAHWTVVLLVLTIVGGFLTDFRLGQISEDWPRRAVLWEADVREKLERELDNLLTVGEDAAQRLVQEVPIQDDPLPVALSPGLRPAGVDAIAVFGPAGELIAWEGSHQGPIPRPVRLGLRPYQYEEGALFGYLYVVRPLPEGRGTAVAATLLRADLPALLEDRTADFVSRFGRTTGAEIQVAREDRVEGESVWDLRWDGDILFSVTLTPASEVEARDRLSTRWRIGIALLLLLAWGLLAWGSRGRTAGPAVAALALPMVVAILPLGALLGVPRIFSPADFFLPGPISLTLGELLALGVVAIFILGFLVPTRLPAFRPHFTAPVGIGVGLLGIHLLGEGASRDLLTDHDVLWVLYQGTGALALGALFFLAILAGRRKEAEGATGWFVGGVVLALLLGMGFAWWIRGAAEAPLWLGLAWGVPLFMVARGLGSDTRWRAGVLRWVGAGTIAVSLILPFAWADQIQARMAVAEERVEKLGTRPDPFLEFLLLRTGEEAALMAATGRNPVEVLYAAWVESGLAREGVPVWLTWWSEDGIAQEELRIGVPAFRPGIPIDLPLQARATGQVVLQRFNYADAHYVAAAPVGGGVVVTAVVPPRRGVGVDSPLGPLFSPARTEPDPLVLIPVLPGERPPPTDSVRWVSTADGLQGEIEIAYPNELYHGHYVLELPGGLLLVARGTLLLLATLAVLLLLWTAGRRLSTGPGDGPRNAWAALTSFRGRVTLALFGFFLLPTVLFGMVAYQTLAGASVRTAEALAARAVDDAASWFFDVDGAMDLLASRVGADLLLYEDGHLVGGSMRELVELGLYEGWIPPEIQQSIGPGEELTATTMATLGGWEYVVAYQRIPGGRVLAAPSPLQAGAMALRQREIADLLGFALILGAGFSVLLALGVGRALTRPIQTLQVASERVGSGNMGVHLPENRTDEFGSVFGAFNRMVDRLAQTRRALVRSSRRTRAIVEEVATGVVALDGDGRVTLANPRAEALLGARLALNQPLPSGDDDPSASALREWVEGCLRDGLLEATTELSIQDRRVRVRARRISRSGASGGMVLAFEDVTDELRMERVLAWGEMAQQVAHEVKNPLTPIKLGVQHIRRAWRDGTEGYDEILDRNVEAILLEIERLASIASSFSRYAAPTPAGETPLERVDVRQVVGEILDLYSAGDGGVTFSAELPEELPSIRARAGELKEVLVNLLENARAALVDSGSVRIDGEVTPETLRLRVHDDGSGISEEALHRIFEPHFSTRSTGTGLGLAIVRRIVESWGGRVRVARTSETGTTMEIEVPLWEVERRPGG